MSNTMSLIDRLRIERVVWTLDQRIYDLPHRSRIAHRREVRNNLIEASRDVGTSTALKNLGDGRQLAESYLTAEFGEGPRASWIAAAVFFLTCQLILTSLLFEAGSAFGKGIAAANPAANGKFTWQGIPYLQDKVTFSFVNGESSRSGGAFTPLCYVLMIAGTICVGRLWHLPAQYRRRRRATALL